MRFLNEPRTQAERDVRSVLTVAGSLCSFAVRGVDGFVGTLGDKQLKIGMN
ncbi:hypothetical protein [Thiosocius teredinicola]|uniref:hypothetical protein n=1 Tax=Thiosocius teredinicola TaxID=1973002 RepID=UPI0013DE678C